jgi:hypothetical protein
METYGLSIEEIQGQHVELLPDRIEMKHRRGRRHVRLVCQSAAPFLGIAGDDIDIDDSVVGVAANQCFVQQA